MYCLHGLRPLSSCIVPRHTFFHRGEFMRREYCPWKFLSAFCAHRTICRKNLVILLHELIVKSDFKVPWYLLYGDIFYLNFYWKEFGYSRDIEEFCNEFCSTQINILNDDDDEIRVCSYLLEYWRMETTNLKLRNRFLSCTQWTKKTEVASHRKRSRFEKKISWKKRSREIDVVDVMRPREIRINDHRQKKVWRNRRSFTCRNTKAIKR